MSDDLVKRLRQLGDKTGLMYADYDTTIEAADRIEKLERENDDTALHLYAFASRIEKLETELRSVVGVLEDPTGWRHVADMRHASDIARKALEGKDD